jgi:tetratricopeptide (TPR) repeat protein
MLALFILCFALQSLRAADPLTETFQKGLFEEEANRDLTAAVKAYEEVVRQLDGQRHLAATAVFRLGECYRKLGRTNDAVAQFQRIVREYSDDETLVKLSRQNLAGLGVGASTVTEGFDAQAQQFRDELVNLRKWKEAIESTPAFEMETMIGVLKDDPRFSYFNEKGTYVGRMGKSLRSLNADLQQLKGLPNDPKIEERTSSKTNELALLTRGYEWGLKELLSQMAEREDAIQRLLDAKAERKQLPEAVRLLEAQVEELKNHTVEELPEIIRTWFENPRLERLCQDYDVQSQALAALVTQKAESHPNVVERRAVVDRLKAQMDEVVVGFINAKEAELRTLKATIEPARSVGVPVGDIAAQRAALEKEIALARKQQEIVKKQVEVGRAASEDSIKAEREVLRLQRELAALPGSASGVVPASTPVVGQESAALEARIAWLKTLNPADLLLAVQTQMPTERLKELARKKTALEDRASSVGRDDVAAKRVLEDEFQLNHERTEEEVQSILRSLELQFQMLRAGENSGSGSPVAGTGGAQKSGNRPDGPLRITLSGAAARPLLIVYPKDYPKDQIPADQITDPSVVVGTVSLSEVLGRSGAFGSYGMTNSVAVKRFDNGELKSWRLAPDGDEGRAFELRDGDIIEIRRKTFVF